MMDILSFLLFFIYSIIILVILVYISPLLSALIMILVPVASIYILPENVIQFLSIRQFSLVGGAVQVYNMHILLLIWSAFIGVIAYAEVLTWYLLKERTPKTKPAPSGDKPKSAGYKIKDFLNKYGNILKGKKINSKE